MRDELGEILEQRPDIGSVARGVAERYLGKALTDSLTVTWKGARKEGGGFMAAGFMFDQGFKTAFEGASQNAAGVEKMNLDSATDLLNSVGEWVRAHPMKAAVMIPGFVAGVMAGSVVERVAGNTHGLGIAKTVVWGAAGAAGATTLV